MENEQKVQMMFKVGDKVKLKDGITEGKYKDEKGNCDRILWNDMIKEAKEKTELTIYRVDEVRCRYELKEIGWVWTCGMLELVNDKKVEPPNVYLIKTNSIEEYVMANSEHEALEKVGISIEFVK